MSEPTLRLVLASASPARLATLRAAGVEPEVIVSGVDESRVRADTPAELAAQLASLKAEAVADQHRSFGQDVPTMIIGCDSVLEIDGEAFGKPHTAEVATARWQRMRGRSGVLHTGHCLIVRDQSQGDHPTDQLLVRGAATTVHFADLDDEEIAAYVATGEPLAVAGAFTLDGLGGPFVEWIEGDPHNVVGISLPLLREMIMATGHHWRQLWPGPRPGRS